MNSSFGPKHTNGEEREKKKKKGKSFSKRSHAIHFVYLYDDILMAHGHVIDDANFGRITGGIIVVYISLCLTLVHVPFML